MNITLAEIVTSTVMFGIIHSIWTAIKWGLKELKSDSGRVIDRHVSDGHHMRLTRCYQDGCAKLRTARDSLRQPAE